MDRQNQTEEWRVIPDTNDKYEVSNLGRVRSLHYNKLRVMPQTRQHHGYHAVMLWVNGKAICKKVHRLVAQSFIPNPDELTDVNHIDGDKDNNQVANLEWCSHQRNVRHAFDTGLMRPHRWTPAERERISQRVKATIQPKRG